MARPISRLQFDETFAWLLVLAFFRNSPEQEKKCAQNFIQVSKEARLTLDFLLPLLVNDSRYLSYLYFASLSAKWHEDFRRKYSWQWRIKTGLHGKEISIEA